MPEKQLSIVPVLSRCPAELLPHSYPGRRAHMCCPLLLLLLHVCGCLWLPPFFRSCCALFVCLPSMSTSPRLCRFFISLFCNQLCPLPCVLSCVLCSNLIAVGTAHMSHSARERLSLRRGVGLGTGIGLAVDCGRDRLDFQSKCSAREQFLPPRPCRTFFPRPLYWAFLILVNKILSNF